MKTSIEYVTVTGVDDFGQRRGKLVKISDGNGRLMVDKVIRMLSRNAEEPVTYESSLEADVYRDFHEQLRRGLLIVVGLNDEQVTKEYFDAVYGVERDAKNPYLTFAKSQITVSSDEISGRYSSPSRETIEAQRKLADVMESYDGVVLMEQALRARRRICNFNKRYEKDEERLKATAEA